MKKIIIALLALLYVIKAQAPDGVCYRYKPYDKPTFPDLTNVTVHPVGDPNRFGWTFRWTGIPYMDNVFFATSLIHITPDTDLLPPSSPLNSGSKCAAQRDTSVVCPAGNPFANPLWSFSWDNNGNHNHCKTFSIEIFISFETALNDPNIRKEPHQGGTKFTFPFRLDWFVPAPYPEQTHTKWGDGNQVPFVMFAYVKKPKSKEYDTHQLFITSFYSPVWDTRQASVLFTNVYHHNDELYDLTVKNPGALEFKDYDYHFDPVNAVTTLQAISWKEIRTDLVPIEDTMSITGKWCLRAKPGDRCVYETFLHEDTNNWQEYISKELPVMTPESVLTWSTDVSHFNTSSNPYTKGPIPIGVSDVYLLWQSKDLPDNSFSIKWYDITYTVQSASGDWVPADFTKGIDYTCWDHPKDSPANMDPSVLNRHKIYLLCLIKDNTHTQRIYSLHHDGKLNVTVITSAFTGSNAVASDETRSTFMEVSRPSSRNWMWAYITFPLVGVVCVAAVATVGILGFRRWRKDRKQYHDLESLAQA
jgi:hypothetical protein